LNVYGMGFQNRERQKTSPTYGPADDRAIRADRHDTSLIAFSARDTPRPTTCIHAPTRPERAQPATSRKNRWVQTEPRPLGDDAGAGWGDAVSWSGSFALAEQAAQ
jgi:hypothetical protein